MSKLHTAFFITLEDLFLVLENIHFVVTIKKSVESTKQPIVLPLTPLDKPAMTTYTWLQLFMIFKTD